MFCTQSYLSTVTSFHLQLCTDGLRAVSIYRKWLAVYMGLLFLFVFLNPSKYNVKMLDWQKPSICLWSVFFSFYFSVCEGDVITCMLGLNNAAFKQRHTVRNIYKLTGDRILIGKWMGEMSTLIMEAVGMEVLPFYYFILFAVEHQFTFSQSVICQIWFANSKIFYWKYNII